MICSASLLKHFSKPYCFFSFDFYVRVGAFHKKELLLNSALQMGNIFFLNSHLLLIPKKHLSLGKILLQHFWYRIEQNRISQAGRDPKDQELYMRISCPFMLEMI